LERTGTRGWGSRRLVLALGVGLGLGCPALAQDANLPNAPSPTRARNLAEQEFAADDPAAQSAGTIDPRLLGQISGIVVDADGDVVDGAQVTLTRDGSSDVYQAKTDGQGRYQFSGIPPGNYKLQATADGLKPGSIVGKLPPGVHLNAPPVRMDVEGMDMAVQVFASQEELAEAEIKVEEHQRIAGFIPNFYVSYDWKAAPLTAKQKYELAWKNVIDPANSAINLGIAGIQQADNAISGYGQGTAGYAKRYGADEANLVVGTMLGGAVFPTLFHQDPRYFYKGSGSIRSRALYALSTGVIARGDNGKWQPAYAGILGDLSAGAAANLYYPAANRTGAALTFENGLIDVGYDALGNLVQEFVFKHLTPHAPNYGNIAHQ